MVLTHLRASHEAARRMEQAALGEVMKAEAEVAQLELLVSSTVYPVSHTVLAEIPYWSASTSLASVPTTNVDVTVPTVDNTALSGPTATSDSTAQPENLVDSTTQTVSNLPLQGNSGPGYSSSVDPQSSLSSEASSGASSDETVWPAQDVRLVAILEIIINNIFHCKGISKHSVLW